MKEAHAKALEPQNNKKSIRKPLEPGSLVLAYNKRLDSQWGKLFANRWNAVILCRTTMFNEFVRHGIKQVA
ncbi:hypothetical protein PCANC_28322 [Puccinia coronata f. sp. avenae]|uniref:Uncharacterized protein n=1 Tax=Puccinia coronata f. sp. avenae TaxID=200324 RepID=A0A2N5TKZ2_9BASI|nr:hypothetical protein PCANC_28322 [Puccinia coronata f. sp. avenae]